MRRISLLLLAGTALALPAQSQAYLYDYRIELIGSIGYTWSEGIDANLSVPADPPGAGNGFSLSRINIESGRSFDAGAEILVTPEVALGFNWGRQEGRLTGDVVGQGSHDITSMQVDNYHGTVTVHFPDPWRTSTPFFMFGLGATKYFFDDINGQKAEGDSRFSSTWGFGLKFHGEGALGLRLMGRWTPTYIKSDPTGYWCNYYGCWATEDLDYSNQFELNGGVSLRL
jgi:hypothetical protein